MTKEEKTALTTEINNRLGDFIQSMYIDYANAYQIKDFDEPIGYMMSEIIKIEALAKSMVETIEWNMRLQKGE